MVHEIDWHDKFDICSQFISWGGPLCAHRMDVEKVTIGSGLVEVFSSKNAAAQLIFAQNSWRTMNPRQQSEGAWCKFSAMSKNCSCVFCLFIAVHVSLLSEEETRKAGNDTMLQKDGVFLSFLEEKIFYGFILAVPLLLWKERREEESAVPCVKLDRMMRSCNIFLLSIRAPEPLKGKAGGQHRWARSFVITV